MYSGMKKFILLLGVTLLMMSCVTYVRETGRFHARHTNLRPYHQFGINGFRLRNKRFNDRMYLYPPENRKRK